MRLLRAAVAAKAKTRDAAERKDKKREGKEARAPLKRKKVRKQAPEGPDGRPREATARDMERWFIAATQRLMGTRVLLSRWTLKEKALAKKILDTYGDDLSRHGVDWIFEHWQELGSRSHGRIDAQPTITALWAFRNAVFTELQTPKRGAQTFGNSRSKVRGDPARTDEYEPMKVRSALGWQDDD